jgi:signal transduction histidine kinase/ligand-binding sensor domain-containing protein
VSHIFIDLVLIIHIKIIAYLLTAISHAMKRCFELLMLLCSSFIGIAQNNQPPAYEIKTDTADAQLNSGDLTQYTVKDGLPGMQVNDVMIDKLGYVWVGTINGLARYDGYEFKRFYDNPNDSTSIRGLPVSSLFEDRQRQIWAATDPSFLNAYNTDSKTFKQYEFSHLIRHPANVEVDIVSMCDDNNGRMYFGADTYYGDPISSALLFKDEKDNILKRFPAPDSLNIQNVHRITKDKTGNIWLISNSGIFKIDTKGTLSRISLMDSEFKSNKDFPCDLQFDKEGHMWIITQRSRLYDLNVFTNTFKIWFPYTQPSKEFNFLPGKIIIDKDDNIWMGTNYGIQFFDRKTRTFSRFNNGIKKELEHTSVVDLCLDSFGTLWVGSHANGLIKYEDKPLLKSYSYNPADKRSLTAGWANFICEASDGKIWITTGFSNRSGINLLDTRTGFIEQIPFTSFFNGINGLSAFWENAPGEFYLGIFKGLYSFSVLTHKLKRVTLAGIPDTSFITYDLKDSKGNEWICTYQGLYRKAKEAQEFKKYDLSQIKDANAVSDEITLVYESKRHGLWILTNNGLFLYNYSTDKIERHGYDKREGDVFATQDINSFYEDPQGIAWVGPWNGGLSKYNVQTKKIKTYTRDDGLPSMSVQAILADEKNNSLWLSTFEGLSRFDYTTEQFINFSAEDGIQSQQFADASFLKTSTGLFAFGGSNGITIFNPDDVTKKSIPPRVFLTDLKLFNKSIIPGEKSILKKPINETERVTLAHDQNNISLDFLAIHYSNPAKNRYSYKLENYDNDWHDAGDLHEVFYPNLPPGNYTFRVKAANDKGVWNEEGATLKIIINQPWWKTNWAYGVYTVLFIAFSFAANRYLRQRLIRKERQRNQVRELEQAKEIEKAYRNLKQTHEALKTTQAQLIQQEKMASLGELTAGIAHEIQNPLNFVNNFSEVSDELLDEMKTELVTGNQQQATEIADDIKQNLEKIIYHGKRADAIVKGMLQHSRASSGQKELTDINNLADEYLRLSYHGMRARDKSFNAEFKTDFDEAIGKINIVPQDIGRVILNVINNAFYAVNEKKKNGPLALPINRDRLKGGKDRLQNEYAPLITVRTKLIPPLEGKREAVEIKVVDNGNGISQNIIDKIFQPFFTTKPTGQGTGLGLSLSYDIIKAHGGEIKVKTEEGEGTQFIIQLPST